MTGDVDAVDFILAEKLGKHLHEIRELPNSEVEEWIAFYEYRNAQEDLAAQKAKR